MPARRRTAKSCSRNWTGTSRRRASSPIGTGPAPPVRASSASARIAYGDLVVIESTTSILTGCPVLEPAALGRVQDRLRAIDGAELAVDVVQVRAHRAGGERELERDLLVDHALGEPLEHVELARGERAGLDCARTVLARVRQVVEHGAQLAGPEADRAGGLEQL